MSTVSIGVFNVSVPYLHKPKGRHTWHFRRAVPTSLRQHYPSTLIIKSWAEEHSIELEFIQPGKPTQNSYVERFNRTNRDEVLNMYVFKTLNEVREITENWIREYNDERPHSSLGDLTPWEYLAKHEALENSNLGCT